MKKEFYYITRIKDTLIQYCIPEQFTKFNDFITHSECGAFFQEILTVCKICSPIKIKPNAGVGRRFDCYDADMRPFTVEFGIDNDSISVTNNGFSRRFFKKNNQLCFTQEVNN